VAEVSGSLAKQLLREAERRIAMECSEDALLAPYGEEEILIDLHEGLAGGNPARPTAALLGFPVEKAQEAMAHGLAFIPSN